jgi:putative membrane protein
VTDAPFDAGLQPERTLLAWRRTCLSLAVAALLVIKLGAAALGFAAGVVGIAVLALAAVAYAVSAARYRRVHREVSAERPVPSAAGAVSAIAASVLALAVAVVAWMVGGLR